jgi:hypothetical protein
VKSLENYLGYSARTLKASAEESSEYKSLRQADPIKASSWLKSKVREGVGESFTQMVSGMNRDYYNYGTFWNDYDSDYSKAIDTHTNAAFKTSGSTNTTSNKQSNTASKPASTSPTKEKSPAASPQSAGSTNKIKNAEGLKNLSADELYQFAKDNGVTGWEHFPEGVKRMRCTMAIKKQLYKSDDVVVIRLGGN